ncbi:fumarate hydratase [Tepidimicrobium xylanilyticum]|uniref:Fumarase, class I alpha subunit n=1 Tax=Tepidimicrobium xylanilyticum TaxID=1123352 RepID=A0A1H3BYM4_9FIRM|nr:fumarate hydratase [Tepidimicrobium xylanilyticum]SDX46309.1 fumarase, class I alpha subunit [Tepidimicrobium xylanilyticum]
MRKIDCKEIIKAVKKACMDANYYIPEDVRSALEKRYEEETWPMAKGILERIKENIEIANKEKVPLCQDTGMVSVFVEMGQDVHIINGSIEKAINEGIRQGYKEGYLRKSVVRDPLNRINTNDNTPAVISYRIVPGDKLKMIIAPKGFGSENMSQLKMLRPADGIQGVKDFVIKTIEMANANPCPPIVVGVGIGGTFDKVASLAKKALMRPLSERHKDEFYRNLEEELLYEINELGIGPQGFGGKTTALAVNIETYPTHIAGLPVAVNINCHVARFKEVEL